MTGSAPRHPEVRYELIADAPERPVESPLSIVRRGFRGQYLALLACAAGLGLAGALAGYHAKPLRYESTGVVLVEGALAPILYPSQENRVPAMFEAYVAAQQAFAHSRTVLDAAVAAPEMRERGWPAGEAGVAELQRSLSVSRSPREHLLWVTVTHRDRTAAQVAVDAVLAAFTEHAAGPPGLSLDAKTTALLEREQDLAAEHDRLRGEMLELSGHYDYDGIARRHAAKVEELMVVDRKLEELRYVRDRLEHGGPDAAAGPVGDVAASVPSLFAVPREALQRLEERERSLVAQIESLRVSFGVKHPQIRDLERQLVSVQIQKSLLDGAIAERAIGPASAEQRGRLDRIENEYVTMRELVREEVERLGYQRITLAELDERVATATDRLALTRQRLDEIRVEGGHQRMNRIRVSSWGDRPIAPVSDRRRSLAVAGALFGAAVGAGLVLFAGLVDPRLRHLDDVTRRVDLPPVLGLLPADRAAGGETDHGPAAHQIRNLLELRRAGAALGVYAITSGDRGEGRTSLALALARSFAGAGSKTLVIDADLGRPGLTRRLDLAGAPGLVESLDAAPGAEPVHAIGWPDLWALPCGTGGADHPECLSHARLSRLLDGLRARFDAIVIDTGPVLDSVEACLVAALADQAIMLLARRQRIDRVRESLARLERAGATCPGLVFNGAPASGADRPAARAVGPPPAPSAAVTSGASAGPLTFDRSGSASSSSSGKRAA